MYKRYHGNSGRVDYVQERREPPPFGPPPEHERPLFGPPPAFGPPPGQRPPPPSGGGFLAPLLGRIGGLERGDLLMLLILWLLYRESGDEELLIIMGAMFLF